MLVLRGRVHAGFTVFDSGEVVIDGTRVIDVRPMTTTIPADAEVIDVGEGIIVPGFVDLMVNGGGGVVFNEHPDQLDTIVNAHRKLGTTSIMGNFITDTVDHMRLARRVVDERAGSDVLGIHWEGPLLSPKRPGMHKVDYLVTEFPVELAQATDQVTTLATVAPECAGPEFIGQLTQVGCRVALGHTNATLDQFNHGVAAGGTLVTHMFNGMRPFTHRDPGIIGGGLTDNDVWIDVINDGYHCDFTAVRLAWLAKPAGKCFFVTDAMSPVGSDISEFTIAGVHVRVDGDRLLTDADGLGGSKLNMALAVRNGVEHVGIPWEEAVRMASLYPALYLGVENRVGQLAPGNAANLLVLDQTLHVQRVMFEGAWSTAGE